MGNRIAAKKQIGNPAVVESLSTNVPTSITVVQDKSDVKIMKKTKIIASETGSIVSLAVDGVAGESIEIVVDVPICIRSTARGFSREELFSFSAGVRGFDMAMLVSGLSNFVHSVLSGDPVTTKNDE